MPIEFHIGPTTRVTDINFPSSIIIITIIIHSAHCHTAPTIPRSLDGHMARHQLSTYLIPTDSGYTNGLSQSHTQ